MTKAFEMDWEFEIITNHVLDTMAIIDQNQLFRYITPSIKDLIGVKPDNILGTNAFSNLHPEDKEKLMELHKNVILTQKADTHEYRVVDAFGKIKYLEANVMPVPESNDNLIVAAIRDITERKSIEKELIDKKNRYRELQQSLMNFSQDMSLVQNITDLESRLLKEINTILSNSEPIILKIDRNSDINDNQWFENTTLHLPKLIIGRIFNFEKKSLIKIGNKDEYTYILIINKINTEESMDSVWLETLVYYASMVLESLNVINNLRDQLESYINKNDTPLWVLRLLFNLSEKERLILSSDLHDTVLQDQINLYRKLETIIDHNDFNSELKTQLKDVKHKLLDIIHLIRITCNELRPPLLRELGLERALENLFEYTQVYSTFKIHFSTENTENLILQEEQTIGIYRIAQELINNAIKHSQAKIVNFHLSVQKDVLRIVYTDDGVGFEPNKLIPSFDNMGITGIRQRIQSLSGKIEFYSTLNKGLEIIMEVPCSMIENNIFGDVHQ